MVHTVCHPALTNAISNGNQQSRANPPWLCQSIAYMKIVENFTQQDFEKNAKGTLTLIDKGHHESSDSWLQFYHLVRVAS